MNVSDPGKNTATLCKSDWHCCNLSLAEIMNVGVVMKEKKKKKNIQAKTEKKMLVAWDVIHQARNR